MAIRRILVPIDFSETSSRALDLALELGGPLRAEMVLLHVIEPLQLASAPELYAPAPGPMMEVLAEQERLAHEELAKIAKRVRAKRIGVHSLVVSGTPYDRIVEAADHLRVDLVVMGTQGRTGLSHLLVGSVAEKVVRLATCPVLTVGKRKRGTARRPKLPRTRPARKSKG